MSMASVNVDEPFEVLEWKINNFCLWNREIHPVSLEQWYSGLHVFPKGLEGNGERLIVHVYDTCASFVDVSFIGSDGLLLCKQQIKDPKWKDDFEELPPGPKFEEIVQARKKNPEQIDTLTIICRLKKDKTNIWYRGESNLTSLDICLKLPKVIFKDITNGQPKSLSSISYPHLDDGDSFIELFAILENPETGGAKIKFNLLAGYETGKVLVHTFLTLRDSNNAVIMYQENDYIFINTLEEWTFSDGLHKSEVVDSGNTLFFRLKVVTGIVENSQVYSISVGQCDEVVLPPSEKSKVRDSQCKSVDLLSKELMNLYQDQEYADFNLHCGEVSFATHRGILSARSPVFKSMLSSGMKESWSNSMEITDLDVHTVGRFLAFLYSGVVEDLQWENALKLYYSADKYEVPSLRNECRSVLISSISTTNVCSILKLAYKHQDEDLLSVSQEFLFENDFEVLKSEEWKIFMLEEPYLASQTATDILLKKSKNGMK